MSLQAAEMINSHVAGPHQVYLASQGACSEMCRPGILLLGQESGPFPLSLSSDPLSTGAE